MRSGSIGRAVGVTLAGALVAAALLPLQSAAAAALPGGKANYVVSLGHLTDSAKSHWVRLSTYQFTAANTVKARSYLWRQSAPAAREGTGTKPDSSCSTTAGSSASLVRTCQVLTAGGFTESPPETRTGTFEVSTVDVDGAPTEVVSIKWSWESAWNEQWYVRLAPDGGLAKLDFKYNTKGTHGYGYGSNAALATRRAMSTVRAYPGTLKQDLIGWSHNKLSSSTGQVFAHDKYTGCTTTTHCMTYNQPSSKSACQATGGCPDFGGKPDGTGDSSIQYYLVKLSSTDRRDTLWHWCRCLAKEAGQFCYTGNSHVKPMLQIIDDNGGFRGWVGVEASFYPYGGANPRSNDMLAVFRVAEFR